MGTVCILVPVSTLLHYKISFNHKLELESRSKSVATRMRRYERASDQASTSVDARSLCLASRVRFACVWLAARTQSTLERACFVADPPNVGWLVGLADSAACCCRVPFHPLGLDHRSHDRAGLSNVNSFDAHRVRTSSERVEHRPQHVSTKRTQIASPLSRGDHNSPTDAWRVNVCGWSCVFGHS
jgi:hypothetical protein